MDETLSPPLRRRSKAAAATAYEQPWMVQSSGLRSLYWLDAASLLPALMLEVAPGMAVLDMCAAPGGKALVFAQQLWGSSGEGDSGGTAPATVAAEEEAAGPLAAAAEPSAAAAVAVAAVSPGVLTCNEPDVKRRQKLQQVFLCRGG